MKFTIWKLGSLEHKIFPTDGAIKKLQNILSKAIQNKEDASFIWGPDLEVLQTEELGANHYILKYDEEGKQILIPVSSQEVVV